MSTFTEPQPEDNPGGQRRRRPMVSMLPAAMTLGNAVCGFASITYAAKLGPERATPDELYFAALLVFGAIIFDGLDGPVARITKQTSEFGARLDSLADAISFGVAPAFLMLRYANLPANFLHPRVLWMTAVLYILCTLLRLARFGVQSKEAEWRGSFCGLPSPAAAGAVASLVIIGRGVSHWASVDGAASLHIDQVLSRTTTMIIPLVTFVVTLLMVSRIRYPRVIDTTLGRNQRYSTLVKIIFGVVIVFVIHELAVPLLFFYYVFSPGISMLMRPFQRRPPINPPALDAK